MAKNCLIYETLNGVKDFQVERKDGMMTLSGVFGVCGVRNNNQRVYEASNYATMVNEMKQRINEEGGIPGELEHPANMNITLENVSHKITDINIDKDGVVSGTIVLLNTPKGQIAQAIVEGGLPLFISSRAKGSVSKTGNVTLEKISTYDLVGSPGFSQARLHLNENQVAESICESIYFVTESEETKNDNNMDQELLERFEKLENRIEELEEENSRLSEQLDSIDLRSFADGIEKWIVEEYTPAVDKWVVEHFGEDLKSKIIEECQTDVDVDSIGRQIMEKYADKIQKWITEDYSDGVQKWCINEFSQGIQKWISEEYSEGMQKWLDEHYAENLTESIKEKINESNISSIGETLKLLEDIEPKKPVYQNSMTITENINEPLYIQNMPDTARVKWNMADDSIKESIRRRAKLYNFTTEGAIDRFWEKIDFDNIKPSAPINEHHTPDTHEQMIRESIRAWRRMRC